MPPRLFPYSLIIGTAFTNRHDACSVLSDQIQMLVFLPVRDVLQVPRRYTDSCKYEVVVPFHKLHRPFEILRMGVRSQDAAQYSSALFDDDVAVFVVGGLLKVTGDVNNNGKVKAFQAAS